MSSTAIAAVILFVTFFGLIILRLPVTFSLVASTLAAAFYLQVPVVAIFQRMGQGVYSFSFLAIPFFILAGEIMATGSISTRLVKVADLIIGRFVGGFAQVNILASTFFGAISGSATADVASVGGILIPMMEEQGYDRDFSVNVTVTSACQSMIIPPSHNMIIFALAAGGLSTGKMFLAGVIPGLLLAVSLMTVTYFIAKKRNYPRGDRYSMKEALVIIKDGILGMMTIAIIMIGVTTGFFTATESAAIACIYSFVVTFFVYRDIPLKTMWVILKRTVRTLAMVLAVIAAANGFCWIMSYLRIPEMATQALLSISDNKYVLLILINVFLLVLGCIMDVAPLIVITTPVLIPVIQQIGMNPIQFGIVLLCNLAIGMCTPPVGATLFAGCAVGKIPMEKCMRGIVPFYAAMVVVLLLVTYVPAVSLFLPNLLMGA
ncbi:MAG: TRAP transporter large permease [Lachnospiraceae bacterium]|jgi:tripartite ATP-independent transporter DctM subunit|nr:TRAP transporter large permease [Lachnospiraceae bacterium]